MTFIFTMPIRCFKRMLNLRLSMHTDFDGLRIMDERCSELLLYEENGFLIRMIGSYPPLLKRSYGGGFNLRIIEFARSPKFEREVIVGSKVISRTLEGSF